MTTSWTEYGEPLHPGMGPELPGPVYDFLDRGAAAFGGLVYAPVIPDGSLPSQTHRDWLLSHEDFTRLGWIEEPAPHPELAALGHWAGTLDLPGGRYRTLILTILTPILDSSRALQVLSPHSRVVVVESWSDLPDRFADLAKQAVQGEQV